MKKSTFTSPGEMKSGIVKKMAEEKGWEVVDLPMNKARDFAINSDLLDFPAILAEEEEHERTELVDILKRLVRTLEIETKRVEAGKLPMASWNSLYSDVLTRSVKLTLLMDLKRRGG